MGRPGVGNPGNSGGYSYTKEYRDNQCELKKLIVDEMMRIMKEGSPAAKRELVLKMGASCLPKEIEVGGSETMNPITIIVKAMDNGNV